MIFYKTVSENTELKPVLKKDYYLYNFFIQNPQTSRNKILNSIRFMRYFKVTDKNVVEETTGTTEIPLSYL